MKTQASRTGIRAILADQRGLAFVLLVVSMVAVASAAALAIDIGMLVTARTESQRAADASALAGASALLVDPDDSLGAVARATDFAARNTVRGVPALVPSVMGGWAQDDVIVMLDESKVRVYVQNTQAYNNPISTFFSRIFGVGRVNVRTMATAWAAPTNSIEGGGPIEDCLLPMGFIDFRDIDGDGYYTPGVDPPLGFDQESSNGLLLKLSFSGSTGETLGPPYCRDEPEEVFNANPDVDYCNGFEDSWSCWWRDAEPSEGGGGGTGPLADAIMGRSCPSVDLPQQVWQASAGGEKQSLIQSDDEGGSFRDLIESDPRNLQWCSFGASGDDPAFGCVQDGACVRSSSACVTESPRIRKAPIISTEGITGNGANNTFTIDNMTGVFIERVACNYSAGDFGGPEGQWNVYVRLMTAGTSGSGGDVGEEPPGGALVRRLRLIE